VRDELSAFDVSNLKRDVAVTRLMKLDQKRRRLPPDAEDRLRGSRVRLNIYAKVELISRRKRELWNCDVPRTP